jgi:hypothetical protein
MRHQAAQAKGAMKLSRTKSKSAAIVTVFRAPDMSKRGRKSVAEWLRRQAGFIESDGDNLASRFTARYLYQ